MTWYWLLLTVFVVFNVGFVCGTWFSGSASKEYSEDLRVEELSV
jgi:hypothetical protein